MPRSCPSSLKLSALWLLTLAGCSSFDLSRNIPWGEGHDGQFAEPRKVIAVWRDTVLHQPGKPPVRGFGGRMMFYGADEKRPVQVEGTMEIYAYDETDRDPTDTRPDRKFVIKAEDMATHYSENALGGAYSVWVPWGPVGGLQREISLIVRFTAADGYSFTGEQTKHLLPGRGLPSTAPTTKNGVNTTPSYADPNVQQAAWQADAGRGDSSQAAGETPRARMRVAEMDLPSRMGGPIPSMQVHRQIPPRVLPREPIIPRASGIPPRGVAAPNYGAFSGQGVPPNLTAPPIQPATGYQHQRRQALGAPLERLDRPHATRQLSHARSPSDHEPQPERTNLTGAVTSATAGGTAIR